MVSYIYLKSANLRLRIKTTIIDYTVSLGTTQRFNNLNTALVRQERHGRTETETKQNK